MKAQKAAAAVPADSRCMSSIPRRLSEWNDRRKIPRPNRCRYEGSKAERADSCGVIRKDDLRCGSLQRYDCGDIRRCSFRHTDAERLSFAGTQIRRECVCRPKG